jgi:hypothetical protein
MKHLIFAAAVLLGAPIAAQAATDAPDISTLQPGQMLAQAYVVRGADYFDKVKADPKMTIESVSDGKRGEPLYLAVMFANPSKDDKGIAKVTYTFTMTYPDGTKQPGPKELKGGDGPMPDSVQKTWVVANAKIKLPLTEASPAGIYKFDVVVKDMNSGTEYKSAIAVDIK